MFFGELEEFLRGQVPWDIRGAVSIHPNPTSGLFGGLASDIKFVGDGSLLENISGDGKEIQASLPEEHSPMWDIVFMGFG